MGTILWYVVRGFTYRLFSNLWGCSFDPVGLLSEVRVGAKDSKKASFPAGNDKMHHPELFQIGPYPKSSTLLVTSSFCSWMPIIGMNSASGLFRYLLLAHYRQRPEIIWPNPRPKGENLPWSEKRFRTFPNF